jgi:hypothetical protein
MTTRSSPSALPALASAKLVPGRHAEGLSTRASRDHPTPSRTSLRQTCSTSCDHDRRPSRTRSTMSAIVPHPWQLVSNRCWDSRIAHFQDHGYTCITPGYPLRDKLVAVLNKSNGIGPSPLCSGSPVIRSRGLRRNHAIVGRDADRNTAHARHSTSPFHVSGRGRNVEVGRRSSVWRPCARERLSGVDLRLTPRDTPPEICLTTGSFPSKVSRLAPTLGQRHSHSAPQVSDRRSLHGQGGEPKPTHCMT